MSRLVIVLATHHELQGAEKRIGYLADPFYPMLLEQLIGDEGVDFVFEEASGLGPTIAEKLSLDKLGSGRYWDVDPSADERKTLGIPTKSNEPFMLGTPPNATFADWQFPDVHARREGVWIQRMSGKEFKKALFICGIAHGLSFSFRLQSSNFTVKSVTYTKAIR